MSLEELSSTLNHRSGRPLVGREHETRLLGAALDAGYRLVFVVEDRPGAGGMSVVRDGLFSCLLSDTPCRLVDTAQALASAYSSTVALAGLLGTIPLTYDGVVVFDGIQPLLVAEVGQDEMHLKGQRIVAGALRAVFERCPALQIVVRCTVDEHATYVAGTALERDAARVDVDPLGVEQTIEVLRIVAGQRWPHVPISPAAMRAAAALAADDEAAALPGAALTLLGRTVMHCTAAGRLGVQSRDVARVAQQRDTRIKPPPRVQLSTPDAGLDRVILPPEVARQVKELLATARTRERLGDWGFGSEILGHASAALFFGPPGTGKSLTAGAIAHALGRPLCRVDGANLTSKWLGESEKLIKDVFRFAAARGAVLLFDEADSLLGRRTAAGHSSDRWSNSIVDQFLQEIDRFDGVAILTTNLEEHLDPALRRRLSFRVRFPLPEAAARTRIWRTLLPASAPLCPDVDLSALGRDYELSGGLIRNAVVRAAVKAASCPSHNVTITMAMLRDAAREQLAETAAPKTAGFVLPDAEARTAVESPGPRRLRMLPAE